MIIKILQEVASYARQDCINSFNTETQQAYSNPLYMKNSLLLIRGNVNHVTQQPPTTQV